MSSQNLPPSKKRFPARLPCVWYSGDFQRCEIAYMLLASPDSYLALLRTVYGIVVIFKGVNSHTCFPLLQILT